MSSQTVTRAIESDFEPKLIYSKLIDASLIPKWAPVFADTVNHVHDTTFRVTKGGDAFDFQLLANELALTVDYLRDMANGRRGGAYIRVTSRPLGGSVVTMTVPVGTRCYRCTGCCCAGEGTRGAHQTSLEERILKEMQFPYCIK
jgi:hypothetical protein